MVSLWWKTLSVVQTACKNHQQCHKVYKMTISFIDLVLAQYFSVTDIFHIHCHNN